MATERVGSQIETLIGKGQWKQAQTAIEKQLAKEPDDHWLWSRLSGVRYEQRQYKAALEAAEKALDIVPDCPLALWSKAGALEALGNGEEAVGLYFGLMARGLEQLNHPDQDANECWEGPDWTAGLMMDCMYRVAGWIAKAGSRDKAARMYQDFLRLSDLGTQGIYSRDDALEKLNKLLSSKKAKREEVRRLMEKEMVPTSI